MRRILYFTGAGLSKSLQRQDKPIPMMWDFIPVLADYIHDNVILTTLATLETNRPYPYRWKSEEAIGLAKILIGRKANRSIENRERFKQALKDKPFESIENLLEKAVSRSDTEATIRFVYAISRVFCIINWRIEWAPLNGFLRKQFALDATHTFVNFNYDLLLDRAIQKAAKGAWDAKEGYGFSIDYFVGKGPQAMRSAGPFSSVPASPLEPAKVENRIRHLKPHGSLNWLLPLQVPYSSGKTGLKFKKGPLILALTQKRQLRYWFSTKSFQYVNTPNSPPMDVHPRIVIPLQSKSSGLSFIRRTRKLEAAAIRNADEIYIIGWSLPKTDKDQERFIRSAITKRKKPIEKLVVVSRGSPPEYFKRVGRIFGMPRRRIHIFNSGFVDFANRAS